jgi:nicotinate dehydrogenase subunit A
MTEVQFVLNGQSVRAQASDEATLLDLLRNTLNLKGTRFGCGEQACGSCMVVVNGDAAFSCQLLSDSVGGTHVETVEGLGESHPLVRAFIAEQAGQCGYCLSGILMSAKALLDRNPAPGRPEIISALEPHLCRCGSHLRIIKAVLRAADMMQASSP